jgi:hypothetical protein
MEELEYLNFFTRTSKTKIRQQVPEAITSNPIGPCKLSRLRGLSLKETLCSLAWVAAEN